MKFTPEELAEMAAADAKIEAEFASRERRAEIMRTERKDALARDRDAIRDRRTEKQKKIADYHRAYRVEHKDEIADKRRAYRAKHKDEIADYHRAYYAEHKDEIAENVKKCFKKQREKNGAWDELVAYRRSHGMTMKDMASMVGMSISAICRMEKGELPRNEKVKSIICQGFST